MRPPDVSVVIPTCGRAELLDRCLDAVLRQSCPPPSFEVIVVDDRPCERTQARVARHAAAASARGLALVYLPNHGVHGPAAARNLGWRHARAPLVAFTDDDTVPHADWLREGCAAFAAAPLLDAGWGRIMMPVPAQPSDYERDAKRLETAGFVTANCFCRRAVLAQVGGFDERFRLAWREDTDLYFSLRDAGARLRYLPQAVVEHPVRPAGWGVSLSQQKKILFDALLYKKHRRQYREQVRRGPRWDYYLFTLSLLVALVAGMAGMTPLAVAAAALWLLLFANFASSRLRGTRRSPGRVAEMLLTSLLIPPLAVFWRAVGAFRFRVLFL